MGKAYRREVAGLAAVLLFCIFQTAGARPAPESDWDEVKAGIVRLLPKGAEVGILAVSAGGDTLECSNPSRMFIPASNLKLLTTGAALLSLGADYQFRTAISYSGRINGSTLEGDLYLVGDGDPTIGASYPSSRPLQSVMEVIYAQLEEAGITSIDGAVVADGRCYGSVAPHEDWDVEDKGFYYGAEVHGINFYENVVDYEVAVCPGTLDITQKSALTYWKPEYASSTMPWLKFVSTASVGEAGTGDRLLYDAAVDEPQALMHGTLASDRKKAVERCTNQFPEYTFAAAVYDFLRESGVSVSDGYAFVSQDGKLRRFDDQEKKVQERCAVSVSDLVTMGRLSSPELSLIIRETNHESDNLYAEALLKAVGSYFFDSGETLDGIMAEKAVLKSALSLDLSSMPIADGCGLSRANRLTPGCMVDYLLRMHSTDVFPVFLHSLPNPGEGTLASVLTSASGDLRGRVFMKSGSMGGVRCYSGYLMPRAPGEKAVAFCIMANRTVEE